ncbi:MAG: hypothetical protein LBP85_09005 [Prevotellaceae bacterium]|nr:hypothetical protein [Prevotellaceae bacterium]
MKIIIKNTGLFHCCAVRNDGQNKGYALQTGQIKLTKPCKSESKTSLRGMK